MLFADIKYQLYNNNRSILIRVIHFTTNLLHCNSNQIVARNFNLAG